ncbi:DUF2976 domain-containing protein [Aggregatibacter actinomycetemcomitans]|uniref:DUF2976 domain-containing protein n=1 Tax=Aggregatibacter actinomycetemcomitans TaxID=714 RepID=UPI00022AD7A5|nr:DUF2976 domain-containing protein [Aggregatibacter actinomycetemcomitans]KOE64188.1 membrane protein [Aggregatibacter actinomycetemcomitans serotype e str. A160]KOE67036.1 membrane protein [Aggregatibacter actinomycetemcomitans serotype e str. SCC393]KYK72982.1 membrane protein [Aggregatibacter actinomycetemcomitans serotype e str. SA2876]
MKLQLIKPRMQLMMQSIARYYFTLMLFLWGGMQNAVAKGIYPNKIPDFKIPGVDSNSKDPMEIIYLVAKSLVTLAAILLSAIAVGVVAKALVKTYNDATDENSKRGWGPFVAALIIGFLVIFFCFWLVKLAVGLF